MANASKKKAAAPAHTRKRTPAVNTAGAKAVVPTIQVGKLDAKETAQSALQLILRHPRNEQGAILADIYKGVKDSMMAEIKEADARASYLHEAAGITVKLMEEIHHGVSVNGVKDRF